MGITPQGPVGTTAYSRLPRLRQACFDDYEQIASLESRNGFQPKKREEWHHLWSNNPAYRDGWPIGWVLENQTGDLVGSLGNIPLLCEFQGKSLITVTGHAWAVDAPYRSYSLLLTSQFFKQKSVDLLVNTTVGAQASSAHTVFGAARVPVPGWDESLFWITHYQGFAESLLATKCVPLRTAISYPAAFALFVKDVIPHRHRQADRFGEVVVCSDFDERFDAFWQCLKSMHSHLLLMDRSRRVLQWHYHYALVQKDLWIFTANRGSQLVAYAIFYRQDRPEYGLKRMRLADFQSLEAESEWLSPMLELALQKCRQEGLHMLEIIGLSVEKQRIVSRFAPYKRKLPSWMYFYKPKRNDLEHDLKNPMVWDPCCYDGDSSL
jgi:hypothetical protein